MFAFIVSTYDLCIFIESTCIVSFFSHKTPNQVAYLSCNVRRVTWTHFLILKKAFWQLARRKFDRFVIDLFKIQFMEWDTTTMIFQGWCQRSLVPEGTTQFWHHPRTFMVILFPELVCSILEDGKHLGVQEMWQQGSVKNGGGYFVLCGVSPLWPSLLPMKWLSCTCVSLV